MKKGRGAAVSRGGKRGKGGKSSMSDLEWDDAQCKMLGTSESMQYDDAFTLQVVTHQSNTYAWNTKTRT